MKKSIRSVLALVLVLGVLAASVATVYAVQPRYTGISSISANIGISSSGAATCKGTVDVDPGYTADLKVELRQDGITIKTWTESGSGTIRISQVRYVTSGHNYIVKATATVYDGNGKVVETPYVYSGQKTY